MDAEMLSSIARGPLGQALVALTTQRDVVAACDAKRINAVVSGNRLSSTNGDVLSLEDGEINPDYLVHLTGKTECVVNLTTLLAMAVAYCWQQQMQAVKAIHEISQHRDQLPSANPNRPQS